MERIVGQRLPNRGAIHKATGTGKFATDIYLPNMLYGKILRSPHPHARIAHIDVSKAEKAIGVKAVVTATDTLKRKFGGLPSIPETVDEYLLSFGKVRYIGESVAAIAAINEDVANEALELIQVEYENLPAVFDPVEAMKDGAPTIHDVPNNIAMKVEMEFGDVENGLKVSDLVQEDEFFTPMLSHCTMEPHASVALMDPTGKLTVWASTQAPYLLQKDLAHLLGLQINKVRIIKTNVGGAFGGKMEVFATEFCSSLLSLKSGCPVKIVYSREEEFVSTRHRHPTIIRLKTGVKRNGKIIAKDCEAIMDGGAYNSFGPALLGRIGAQMSLVYKASNFRFKGYLVYTNKPVSGAMRGVTNFQARFADDSQMDIIAQKLKIDPIEIRVRNARKPGETTPHDWKITSCGLTECLQEIRKKANNRPDSQCAIKKVGTGVSCWGYYSGAKAGHAVSTAFIKVDENGAVSIITGAEDIGQGSNIALCQIAAEELGVSIDKVNIITGDTDITPIDLGTWLSRLTYFGGNAVKDAAIDAKRQISKIASGLLGAKAEDLHFLNNQIIDSNGSKQQISIKEVVKVALYGHGQPILGKGIFNPSIENTDPRTGKGNTSPAYAFGAVLAEVEVNTRTGQIMVNRIISATDCGLAINPMTAEGQIEGAMVMGLGAALSEELKISNGKVLNSSFLDYKVPRSLDCPEQETLLIETIDPGGPFGAKGISEGAAIPIAPAIANAIYDAIGIRFRRIPITSEKVIQALSTHSNTD